MERPTKKYKKGLGGVVDDWDAPHANSIVPAPKPKPPKPGWDYVSESSDDEGLLGSRTKSSTNISGSEPPSSETPRSSSPGYHAGGIVSDQEDRPNVIRQRAPSVFQQPGRFRVSPASRYILPSLIPATSNLPQSRSLIL